MEPEGKLDFEKVLDRLEQGLLIFNHAGRLIYENQASHTLLGHDLSAIRSNGWAATTVLFNSRQTNPDYYLGAVREKALAVPHPIRFQIFRSGEVVPCWLVTFEDAESNPNTMITLEVPDWTAMVQLINRFHHEMKESVIATQGHIDLIHQSIQSALDTDDAKSLGRRVSGFSRLISIHMHRTNRFLDMIERMEAIRAEEERAERARNKRQATYDRSLLATYSNEKDMHQVRDGKILAVEALIQLTQSRIKSMNRRLATLNEEAADFERSGKKLPKSLAQQITNLQNQIRENKAFVITKEDEKITLGQKFEKDILRYRELRGTMKQ